MATHSIRLTISCNTSGDAKSRNATRSNVRGVFGRCSIDKLPEDE